jgi:hypothetical protein
MTLRTPAFLDLIHFLVFYTTHKVSENGCFHPQVRRWEVESKNPVIPRNNFVLLEIYARGM